MRNDEKCCKCGMDIFEIKKVAIPTKKAVGAKIAIDTFYLKICKNCGYKSNDDRIGAMNLYRMGINYLTDSQVPSIVTAE